MNFTNKQKNLMATLGYVSDREISICYEGFAEAECEMRANGIPGHGNFTRYLEVMVHRAAIFAKYKNQKALA